MTQTVTTTRDASIQRRPRRKRMRAVRCTQAADLGLKRRNTPSALGRSKDMNRVVRFVLDGLQVP